MEVVTDLWQMPPEAGDPEAGDPKVWVPGVAWIIAEISGFGVERVAGL